MRFLWKVIGAVKNNPKKNEYTVNWEVESHEDSMMDVTNVEFHDACHSEKVICNLMRTDTFRRTDTFLKKNMGQFWHLNENTVKKGMKIGKYLILQVAIRWRRFRDA